jgi:hypothetical protein
LNNKLRQQGIAEYQRALQTAPNSLLADVIRKRLEMLHDSESASSSNLSSNNLSSSDLSSNNLSNISAKIQTEPASSLDNSGDTGITRWVNGIPKPIVDSFAKKVQPVLVSRCASSACHGSVSENQFKLRIPSHTFGNTTYRNLRSVLQWIDLDYPAESQLLSVLVSYHGGAKAPFSVESPQYNNIVQWVRLAAKELPAEYRSQSVAAQKKNKNNDDWKDKKELEFPLKGEVLPPALRNVMNVNHSGSKTNQPETPPPFLVPPNSDSIPFGTSPAFPSNGAPANYTILQKSATLDTDSPKDPFDPDIFNSRYHHY